MKVLLLKIGAIGDVVMALPAAAELKRRHPRARLTWVCAAAVAPLLHATGLVDELVTVNERRLYGRSRLARAFEAARTLIRLAGRRFDRVFVPYHDRRYRWLVALTRKDVFRHWGGTDAVNMLIPGRDHAQEYARGLLGDAPTSLPYPRLRSVPESAPGLDGVTVAIAPGGAVNFVRAEALRRWPVASYRSLAEALIARGVRVALTGAPSDVWVRSYFEGLAVSDFLGSTDLPGLVALYARCGAVVTHDSGPLHLAKLAQVPVVGLFGPTRPSEKLVESGTAAVFWGGADLPCRPCYDGRNYAKCSDNRCMQSIPVDAVAERVMSFLER
ncbi:MAG: glycosyltransferase family 9 protein [Bdellovibrionales bacterium]|nr:glycosyltransferase family 9 protein [Bdellovibrionales bacterium]